MTSSISRCLVRALFVLCAVGLFPSLANAAPLVITRSGSLTADQTRQIQINANNVTLDCKGKHIKFPTAAADRPLNCNSNTVSCALRITGRSNVTIKNCNIDPGAWGLGIWVDSSVTVTLQNTVVAGTTRNVRIADSNIVLLSGFHSLASSLEGVEVRRVASLTVDSASESSNNGIDGYDINGCRDGRISGRASGNAGNGFELDPDLSPVTGIIDTWVTDCTADSNGNNGVSLDSPTECKVRSCTLRNNNDNGLKIERTGDGGLMSSITESGSGGFGLAIDPISVAMNGYQGNSFGNGMCLITPLCTCNQRSNPACVSPFDTNLALGHATVQSTVALGAGGWRVNDGDTRGDFWLGSVNHTELGFMNVVPGSPGQYWYVDLGSERTVNHVNIFNRTDCCTERLSHYNVLAWNSGGAFWTVISDHSGDDTTGASFLSWPVGPVTTQYVMIAKTDDNYLHVAEVQVLGN